MALFGALALHRRICGVPMHVAVVSTLKASSKSSKLMLAAAAVTCARCCCCCYSFMCRIMEILVTHKTGALTQHIASTANSGCAVSMADVTADFT
jgi:hypothetical protein